jgi:hypothetical protein
VASGPGGQPPDDRRIEAEAEAAGHRFLQLVNPPIRVGPGYAREWLIWAPYMKVGPDSPPVRIRRSAGIQDRQDWSWLNWRSPRRASTFRPAVSMRRATARYSECPDAFSTWLSVAAAASAAELVRDDGPAACRAGIGFFAARAKQIRKENVRNLT